MSIDFKNLRPAADYPVYPPYHKGHYLEEHFYSFYKEHKNEFDKTGYTLIPIFWTNVYITNKNVNLVQPYLDSLPIGKYFTVSQHDDAVKEQLPIGTLSFEAGGNGNGIPIPLICSPIDEQKTQLVQKDIFCSFVGSITHSIRTEIYNRYSNDSSSLILGKNWTSTVSEDSFNTFIDITKRSKFSLCPRGYGAQSFRLYEVLQLNTVPVVIYDKEWFPFNDVIDWNSFCVTLHIDNIDKLKTILESVTDQQYEEMLQNGKRVYNKYFTMNGMSTRILQILQA